MITLRIVRRILLQTFNDKRSLAMILVAPVFLLTLIFLLLGKSGYQPKLAISDLPSALAQRIEEQDVAVTSLTDAEGRDQVKSGEVDAFLYQDESGFHLLFSAYDSVKTGMVQKSVAGAMQELSPGSSLQTEFLYGTSDASLFDSLGYLLLSIVSFFFIFVISGISFVRERTNQTMERLMMTPVHRWQVILGYTLGFGLFGVIQSIILLAYSVGVLHMEVAGSLLAAGLVMILLAMSAVCIGAFFSLFSNNEFQVMQFIPIVVIPQIFFSGLIAPDTLPYHLGAVSRIMPVYYACRALKSVAILDGGFREILPDVGALLAFILLFFFLNIQALKKYRTI